MGGIVFEREGRLKVSASPDSIGAGRNQRRVSSKCPASSRRGLTPTALHGISKAFFREELTFSDYRFDYQCLTSLKSVWILSRFRGKVMEKIAELTRDVATLERSQGSLE
jgi:hypothetical protein